MENKFLSDNEIIEMIKEYIDDTIYNRAILIDGAWGTGKTFFVKNKLIKELQEDEKLKRKNISNYTQKKIIYISLYGVASTVDITNEIYLKSINIENKDSKIYSLSTLGGKFLSDLMKNKGFDISKYLDDAKNFIDINNTILVFDDLERCKCNISDILGYINNFVEHRNMKVIIVVNEEELGNTSNEKQKLIETIKMSRSKVNKELLEGFRKNNNNQKQDENKDTIEYHNANKMEQYLKIKEKLVGTTIKYKPNLIDGITVIIENNIEDNKLKNALIKNIDLFVQISQEKEHVNLRTFQFFISKLNKLYLLIKNTKHLENEEVLNEIIKYTFLICIYYKKGIYVSQWKTDALYGEVALEPYTLEDGMGNFFSEHIVKGFRFIDDCVVYSKVCDLEVIDRTIQLFLDDLKISGYKNDPLNKLEYWYILEDKDVEKYIDELYCWLKDKKYSPNRFPKIVKYLNVVESLGFNRISIEKDILPIMVEQIQESNLYINYIERSLFVEESEELQEKYNIYLEVLMKAINYGNHNTLTEDINKCLDNINTWGSELSSFYYTSIKEQKSREVLLRNIDLEKLKYNIKHSNTEQIEHFRGFLLSLYDKNYNVEKFEIDKDTLIELMNFISGSEIEYISSITKRNNLKWLKHNLTDIINRI